MNEEEYFKQQVIEEIKRIAKEKNLKTMSLAVFRNSSVISVTRMWKTFNSWREAVQEAGLKPDTTKIKKTKDELGEEFLRICKEIEGIPNIMQFNRTAKISINVYKRNFGNHWEEVLFGFKEWLKEKHPNSKFINLITNKSKPRSTTNQAKDNEHTGFVWQSKKGVVYGAPIDFRGLRQAPVNEQGVVFLFGKISEELGFSIEAIKTAFPDCEGKRLIDRRKNHWENVSIEFEYSSSNFYQHGHDASKCDVIVCWMHDWLDCPLEVIELREVVKQLKNKGFATKEILES